MEKIKMVDLYGQYSRVKTEIDEAIQQVLDTTSFIQGPQVEQFSCDLANYTGAKFAITCANGTDALQIAMMALDLRPGDEVIIPVHTYVATAEVIALLGLKPIFVDVDAATFNVDISQLERKITDKTKAMVPVHLYGQCADMEPILQLAGAHGLSVIEDAAQSLSAEYVFQDGTRKKAGTMGIIGTTSFFPSKNLGCFGDGGALFTNDETLADKIKMISNHGQKTKYRHDIIGVNSRLDTLQAAILRVKLKYLDDYTARRQRVAAVYDRAFVKTKHLDVPFRASNSTHVFHQYTLKIRDGQRDDLKNYLSDQGIPSMIYYPMPLHYQPAFRRPEYGEGTFPITENLSKIVISLPIHTEMSQDHLDYVCDKVNHYFSR